MFEWTFTIGNITTALLMFTSALWVIASMRAEIRILDSRLIGVEKAIVKITDILITVTRQDERIKIIEERVEQLYQNGSKRLNEIIQESLRSVKHVASSR